MAMSSRPKISDETMQKVEEFRETFSDRSFSGANKAIEYLVEKGIEYEKQRKTGELTEAQRDAIKEFVEKLED